MRRDILIVGGLVTVAVLLGVYGHEVELLRILAALCAGLAACYATFAIVEFIFFSAPAELEKMQNEDEEQDEAVDPYQPPGSNFSGKA